MICPECGKEYDAPIAEMEEKDCLNCGKSLLEGLPGYPNRESTDIWTAFGTGWEIFISNIVPLLRYLIVPLVLISILNLTALSVANTVFGLKGLESGSIDPGKLYLIKLSSAFVFVSFIRWFFLLFFMGGVVTLAKDAFVGRKAKARRALGTLKSRLSGLFGASALLMIILTGGAILSILVGLNVCLVGLMGLVVSLVLFVLFLYWFLFTLPILVLENRGPLVSIVGSRRLSISRKGTLKFTLTFLFLYNVSNSIISYIAITGNILPRGWSIISTNQGLFNLVLQVGRLVLSNFLMLLTLSFFFICITVYYQKISE